MCVCNLLIECTAPRTLETWKKSFVSLYHRDKWFVWLIVAAVRRKRGQWTRDSLLHIIISGSGDIRQFPHHWQFVSISCSMLDVSIQPSTHCSVIKLNFHSINVRTQLSTQHPAPEAVSARAQKLFLILIWLIYSFIIEHRQQWQAAIGEFVQGEVSARKMET